LKENSAGMQEFSGIDKLKYVIANLAYNVMEENQIYDLVELEWITSTGHQKLLPQLFKSNDAQTLC